MIQNRLLLAGLMAIPALGHALGLGKLELNSALNEPFDARIELLSASVEELDSLKVILADSASFERANIERPFLLSQLKFEVKETEGGGDFIHIHTSDAIREPFLNFLLEISWSRGRLYREYTVLLDPPLYDPNARRQSKVSASSPETSAPTQAVEDNNVVYDLDYQQPATPRAAVAPTITGNQYGPTQSGDTLWSIAASMRPNNSVSVQQVMNALFQANPAAFIDGNINGLKKGQVLNLPDMNTIQSMGEKESIDLVRSQEGLWNDLRDQQAENPAVRAETSDTSTSDSMASSSGQSAEDDPELRLLSAETDAEGIDYASDMESAEGDVNSTTAINDEAIAVLEMQNQDLQNRLSESESIIEDLKRLIQLKEDELAALQNQFASPDASMEATEVVTEEVVISTEDTEAVVSETDSDLEFEEDESDTELMEEESDTEMVFEDDSDSGFEEETEAEEVADESTESETAVTETSMPVEQNSGAMGLVEQYLAPIQGFVMTNLALVGGALGAILLAILGLVGYRKMQTSKAESVELPLADLPDFDEDATETASDTDATAAPDSTEQPEADDADEDATVIRDSEDETVIPDAPAEEAAAEDFSFELGDDEEEEDPLAEVNVFLAYEHFDQAEEFVKNAINDQPDNLEFHSKLLEVYYASGNKSAYEDAAKVLHEKSGGSGEHWDMAVAMWSEMSPNRALFEERAEGMEETMDSPEQEGEGIVDIFSADDADSDSETLDISAGGSDILDMTTSLTESDDDNSLDFTDTMDMTDTISMEEPVVNDADDDDDDLLDLTASDGDEEDDLLDLTAEPSDEEMLDVTSAAGIDQTLSELDGVSSVEDDDDDLLDITGGVDEDDLLDASSAGLGALSEADESDVTEDDDVLDISGSGLSLDDDDDADDNSVDFELPAEEDSSDLLDASSEINMDTTQAGEDLLDVTSASVVEDAEEDSSTDELGIDELDDSGTSMDLDLDGLDLELPDSDSSDDVEPDAKEVGDDTIERAMEPSNDDNVLEFDVTAGAADSTEDELSDGSADDLLIDVDDDADNSLDIDMDLTGTGGGISEDFSLDIEESEDDSESLELDEDLSLDMDISDDSASDDGDEDNDGLEIDLADTSDLDLTVGGEASEDSMDLDLEVDAMDDLDTNSGDDDEAIDIGLDADDSDSDELDLEISLDDDSESNDESGLSVSDIDFDMTNTDTLTSDDDDDLSLDLEIQDDGADDLDMEGTVELPQGAVPTISIDDDDEDDDDATVFVPKSPGSEEQSQEDEVSTKLDLAKAYVELGDQDSARSILNEILQEGNDSQKQQAQELMSQVNS